MKPDTHPTTPHEKALAVNLDPQRYGTFAEIGAGQEVVRWFFQAGGAAGTIAKSISAYDMTVSDAIYGECDRYVARERLEAMLGYEFDLMCDRLAEKRGHNTAFFAFADTVTARSYAGNNECHGWMGIRFQSHPRDEASQIIMHVRMWDAENAAQQEALGIVGLNLVYGACFLHHQPERLIESLLDALSTERIEVDMIEFRGIEFRHVDNRVMSLLLVQLGLTDAAMFASDGAVLQPSEVLRKRRVVVERGRFRPVTLVNVDMLDATLAKLADEHSSEATEAPLTLLEITMSNLLEDGRLDLADFLNRVDVLAATGHTVLISDFFEYYRLAAYLSRYTSEEIAIVLGGGSLGDLFDENHYQHLAGGTLESFGRLFKNDVKVYVYPRRVGERVVDLQTFEPPDKLRQLFRFLVERGVLVSLDVHNPDVEHIFSRDVLARIRRGDATWEGMVPDKVAHVIREKGLFGAGRN